MIARLDARHLRALADQLDAYGQLRAAGADHPPDLTVIKVNGLALAYLHWWEDEQTFMASLISFTPRDAEPLTWHNEAHR